MKLLALVLLLYTLAMLGVHLTSWKLVERWYATGSSWVKRWLSPLRVIRGEAVYWALALLAWPLWRSVAWKTIVAIFATLHLVGWLVAELNRTRLQGGLGGRLSPRALALAVAAFDFVEAFALVAIGWFAARYLFRA